MRDSSLSLIRSGAWVFASKTAAETSCCGRRANRNQPRISQATESIRVLTGHYCEIDREDGVKAVKFLQILVNSIQMAERKNGGTASFSLKLHPQD